MNKKLIALAIAAVLSIPAYAAKPIKQVEVVKPVDMVAVIAKDFEKVPLKDPSSLQLRNLVTYNNGVTCGEFNAKNSMGGYNGFEPFVRTQTGEISARITVGPDLIGWQVTSYCADGDFNTQQKEVTIKRLKSSILNNSSMIKTDRLIAKSFSTSSSAFAQQEAAKYLASIEARVKKGEELEKQLLELTEGVK